MGYVPEFPFQWPQPREAGGESRAEEESGRGGGIPIDWLVKLGRLGLLGGGGGGQYNPPPRRQDLGRLGTLASLRATSPGAQWFMP